MIGNIARSRPVQRMKDVAIDEVKNYGKDILAAKIRGDSTAEVTKNRLLNARKRLATAFEHSSESEDDDPPPIKKRRKIKATPRKKVKSNVKRLKSIL